MEVSFEHLLRDAAPQVLGVLTRRYRDFAAAEDAVQEALLAAATQWKRDGVPQNPKAWLMQVAVRRLTDEIRSNAARRRREDETAMGAGYVLPAEAPVSDEEDDTLVLMYMCSHPSLTTSSAIALTLRAVGGLTTAEIARAFLVPEPTMAQRISRAKQTIKDAGATFEMPGPSHRADSLRSVLHVLYLIFNEGYTASAGEQLQRTDLASEAIRLTRLLHAKSGNGNPELSGLLALMLLTDARRHARTGSEGHVIPLDQQDRALWDRALISEGVELLTHALKQGSIGPYQLQAAIAAVHDEASSAEQTDWPQIVALYDLLIRMADNPVVRLNHAVAVSMVQGPRAGLDILSGLGSDERMRNHHRFYSVRGHLYERADQMTQAAEDYEAAASKTASLPERNYLLAQAARVRCTGSGAGNG